MGASINRACIRVYNNYLKCMCDCVIGNKPATTVKPVFKGHCDERTPCDQGTLSQNGVLSSPC